MKDATPQPVHLKDYKQPDFWIPEVELRFDIRDDKTVVRAKLRIERNLTQEPSKSAPLSLNGEKLSLVSASVDGRVLAASEYALSESHLTISGVPDRFHLELVTEIEPHKNLSCEGLYKSAAAKHALLCTQCEAESFRRITFFLDRPDVMSVYTVSIEADKKAYPVLLSNGNPVARRDLTGGRHEITWKDPFKKPCYLFALVAGDLGVLEDKFTTRSGREVTLQIFAAHGLQDRCRHAMESLKASMKWDEDVYGLEYDLDIYMIVVAEDFNMGAMENKGLNVFNANYILAQPETATDSDFDSVAAVVAHEYFHNWTGNRITCRDWFQLSLKEGLTVFRDQRFSSDMGSAAVKRIEDVIRLRTHQFAEDAGPMAHPIRPQSYISIDNFYTMTVYEKGSEVIRMIETLLGREGFRKGMDLYFKRHDGQAVTTEDFVAAMADANSMDFTQFKNWYDQAGTPVLKVDAKWDAASKRYSLTIEQSCAPSPGQPVKKPYHVPVKVGLLGRHGKDLALKLENPNQVSSLEDGSVVLHLRASKETFVFSDIAEKPVLSFLRNFSAPVRVEYDASNEDLAFQMAHDSDEFARWEAAQTLTVRVVKDLVADSQAGRAMREPKDLVAAFGPVLDDRGLDRAFVSFMLTLPAEQYLAQFFKVVDVDAIHAAREHVFQAIARAHRSKLEEIYALLERDGTEGLSATAVANRALRTRVLVYLTATDQVVDLERAVRQRRDAKNMTDELGALEALIRSQSPQRRLAFDEFYAKWKNETLVINKWLATQAISPAPNTLDEVKRLSQDPVFDKNNPNKIYSLYVAFSKFNLVRFHDKTGAAYRFIADQVMDIDSRNPQVAARLMSAFNQWRIFDPARQTLMKNELERILAKPGLSSNVFEIASKTLG